MTGTMRKERTEREKKERGWKSRGRECKEGGRERERMYEYECLCDIRNQSGRQRMFVFSLLSVAEAIQGVSE